MSLSELLPTILRNYFNVGDSWAKSQVIIEYGVDIKKDWKTTLRGQEKLVDLKKKKKGTRTGLMEKGRS